MFCRGGAVRRILLSFQIAQSVHDNQDARISVRLSGA